MSIRSRAARSLTPRKMLATTALTVVAALGLVVAAPGSDAFAAGPITPQERVAASIEHGHLIDDYNAGRITDDDLTAVGKTGLDVAGQHFDKWLDLTPEQQAAQAKAAAQLRTAAESDPATKASIESLKSAQTDSQVTSTLDDTSTDSRPAPLAADAPVTESKHWWNHIHIHIGPIHIPHVHVHVYIDHKTIHVGNALVRAILTGGVAAAVGLVCAAFPDITKVTCVLMAAGAGALVEFIKTKGICGGHGIEIPIPEIWKVHCP